MHLDVGLGHRAETEKIPLRMSSAYLMYTYIYIHTYLQMHMYVYIYVHTYGAVRGRMRRVELHKNTQAGASVDLPARFRRVRSVSCFRRCLGPSDSSEISETGRVMGLLPGL